MTLKEFEKFKSLMMMTTSSQEGEALNAIRLANAILAKDNRNWDDVLNQVVTVTSAAAKPAVAAPMAKSPEEIEEAFEFILDSISPASTFRGFIESLHVQWEARHYLTPRQLEVLFNAYERQSTGKAAWKKV